jgi:hypothetical protein
MRIFLRDKLYELVERYALKHELDPEDVIVAAIISYISRDPEIALALLENNLEFKKYLTKKEKELLLKILELPREERTAERIKELIGEKNFQNLLKRNLLRLREYEGRQVYEVPYVFFKQLEPLVSKEKEYQGFREELERMKREYYPRMHEKEEKKEKPTEFPIFRRQANEKYLVNPELTLPERAVLSFEDVKKALNILRSQFPNEFTLKDAIEALRKAFPEYKSEDIELIVRAAIAQLYINGEIYNPQDLVFAWV